MPSTSSRSLPTFTARPCLTPHRSVTHVCVRACVLACMCPCMRAYVAHVPAVSAVTASLISSCATQRHKQHKLCMCQTDAAALHVYLPDVAGCHYTPWRSGHSSCLSMQPLLLRGLLRLHCCCVFEQHQCCAGVCSHLGVAQLCAEGHSHLCGLLSYPDACLCPGTATGEVICKLPCPIGPVCNKLLCELDDISS